MPLDYITVTFKTNNDWIWNSNEYTFVRNLQKLNKPDMLTNEQCDNACKQCSNCTAGYANVMSILSAKTDCIVCNVNIHRVKCSIMACNISGCVELKWIIQFTRFVKIESLTRRAYEPLWQQQRNIRMATRHEFQKLLLNTCNNTLQYAWLMY